MSKSAQFLGPKQALPYKMRLVLGSIDVFHVPPPPLNQPLNDEESDQKVEITPVYTIVPGQISAAAQRRNIEPHDVYASDGWMNSRNSPEDEEIIERSYYYRDHYYEDCDHCFPRDCVCDGKGRENKGNSNDMRKPTPLLVAMMSCQLTTLSRTITILILSTITKQLLLLRLWLPISMLQTSLNQHQHGMNWMHYAIIHDSRSCDEASRTYDLMS